MSRSVTIVYEVPTWEEEDGRYTSNWFSTEQAAEDFIRGIAPSEQPFRPMATHRVPRSKKALVNWLNTYAS